MYIRYAHFDVYVVLFYHAWDGIFTIIHLHMNSMNVETLPTAPISLLEFFFWYNFDYFPSRRAKKVKISFNKVKH